MPKPIRPNSYRWLSSGDEIFPALAGAIDRARKSVRFEIYTYANDEQGWRFRDHLTNACQRGARVHVLLDAFGSQGLPADFWEPFTVSGGLVRWFNPGLHKRLGLRDHRKMLVCDEEIAFVGGFNISMEYQGDGVKTGWFDLGLEVISPLAVQLAAAFDEMFEHCSQENPRFKRPPRSLAKRAVFTEESRLLLTGPAFGRNPFSRALRRDLARARTVQIIVAYFLPTWRIRRELARVARRGGKVQLIVPAKSDVLVSQLAGRSLYRRLLRAGVEIYEYQPQILHAKLYLIDQHVYAGSSNLDPRSLYINYELMVRFEDPQLVSEARELFTRTLGLCQRIELEAWRKSRSWWRRVKHRWAYFLLVRIDPLVARWGLHRARRRKT
jgi:cardiolipin synthase